MKYKLFFTTVIVLSLFVASCGQEIAYIEGEKTDNWSVGVVEEVVASHNLRVLGEVLVESWLSFSYMSNFKGIVNPLSAAQNEYNIKDGTNRLGKPETINSSDDELGFASVVFGSGCIGKLDLAKNSWVEWEMAGYVPYAPPVPTQADIETNRELDDNLAIMIATDFLVSVMGYNLKGYVAKVIDEFSIEGKTILFSEKLTDTGIDSPNWVRVNIDFWGFIRSFVSKVDKTPIISTKPTISEDEAIEFARKIQNLSDKIQIPTPNRAIKRTRTVENLGQDAESTESFVKINIMLTDTLVWHFDFFGVDYSVMNMTLSIDAHTGEKLD